MSQLALAKVKFDSEKKRIDPSASLYIARAIEATGKTRKEIAREISVSEQTLSRNLRHPEKYPMSINTACSLLAYIDHLAGEDLNRRAEHIFGSIVDDYLFQLLDKKWMLLLSGTYLEKLSHECATSTVEELERRVTQRLIVCASQLDGKDLENVGAAVANTLVAAYARKNESLVTGQANRLAKLYLAYLDTRDPALIEKALEITDIECVPENS